MDSDRRADDSSSWDGHDGLRTSIASSVESTAGVPNQRSRPLKNWKSVRTYRSRSKIVVAEPEAVEEEETGGRGEVCEERNISISRSSVSSGKETIGSISHTFSGWSLSRSENGESSGNSTAISMSGSSDRAKSVRTTGEKANLAAPSELRHPGVHLPTHRQQSRQMSSDLDDARSDQTWWTATTKASDTEAEESTLSHNSSVNTSVFYRGIPIDDDDDVLHLHRPSPQNRPFGQPLFPHQSSGYHRKHDVGGSEEERRMKTKKKKKEGPKRYCMPMLGGINLVACYRCSTVVQIPQDLRVSRTAGNSVKLRCGNALCGKIIGFSIYDGMHIVPLKRT